MSPNKCNRLIIAFGLANKENSNVKIDHWIEVHLKLEMVGIENL
jgi:hypothetical protein